MTAVDYPAMLRGLADHIEKHDLSDPDLLSAYVGKHDRAANVQVMGLPAVWRWQGSLAEVSAEAQAHDDRRIHVWVTGQAEFGPIEIVYVVVEEREPGAFNAVLTQLPNLDDRVAIDLDQVLTGGTR